MHQVAFVQREIFGGTAKIDIFPRHESSTHIDSIHEDAVPSGRWQPRYSSEESIQTLGRGRWVQASSIIYEGFQ